MGRRVDADYRYELRRSEEGDCDAALVARPLEVGERIAIGSHNGIVRAIDPLLHERELHLVVRLWRDD